METAAEIRIEPFRPEMLTVASRVLARAFVTNPLHVATFGAGQLAKNEAFFRHGLAVMKGPKLVALEGSRILGVIHWVHSSACQISSLQKLRLVPAMLGNFGPAGAVRVSRWLSTWAAHDPTELHCHLGPIGVEPAAQGRHIGYALMERYCEELDRTRTPGYLETDRPENVAFYRRFGFDVTSEVPLLGVRSYFMWRAARSSA